jgi:hypothetical protein
MTHYLRQLQDEKLNNSTRVQGDDIFELVYLRHRYFRQSNNPSNERLLSFKEMSDNMAGKNYFTNVATYNITGFELEDIRSIAQIHVVSFIGMSGLKENKDKMEKFISIHKQRNGQDSIPTEKDIFTYECHALSSFLKQRLNELVRFCKNKNAKIRGTRNLRMFFVGPGDLDPTDEELVAKHKKIGFEKISSATFVKIRTKNKPVDRANFIDKDTGNRLRGIYHEGSDLTIDDIDCTALDFSLNAFYMNPEDIMILNEKK